MKKILFAAVCILLCLCSLSCARKLKMTDEEALEVSKNLLPKTADINEIFFGAGLEPDKSGESDGNTVYFPVKKGCGFDSVNSIKKYAEEVFSDNYLSSVYETVFNGTTIEGDNGIIGSSSPRYKELENGLNVNVKYASFNIRKIAEVKEATVTKRTSTFVSVLCKCVSVDGEEFLGEFAFTKQASVWKVDGPTY